MSYYDLFEVPDGYETDLVLLIAPYFDPKFIKMLAKKLSPEKLRIVVDDSVRFEEIKQLTKASSGIADVRIALGRAAGLVHMKGYYVEFVRSDGRSRRRRRFFYGSANATDAAFDGRWNAELIASVDLFAGEDGEFLEYLSQLVAAVENGSGDILDLRSVRYETHRSCICHHLESLNRGQRRALTHGCNGGYSQPNTAKLSNS